MRVDTSVCGYERLKNKIDFSNKRRCRSRGTFGDNTNNGNFKISFKPSGKRRFLSGTSAETSVAFLRARHRERILRYGGVRLSYVCGQHSVVIPSAEFTYPRRFDYRRTDRHVHAWAVKRRRQSIGRVVRVLHVYRRAGKRSIGDVKNLKLPKSIDASRSVYRTIV